jgi:hypothetical protein
LSRTVTRARRRRHEPQAGEADSEHTMIVADLGEGAGWRAAFLAEAPDECGLQGGSL